MYYKAFAEENKVSGRAILSAVNILKEHSMNIDDLLAKYGLTGLVMEGWYHEQDWLDALQAVSVTYGPNTIFTLGKGRGATVPDPNADFKSLLINLDAAYKSNHINGEVGYFLLESFDEKKKFARLKMHTPYPPEYGKGVLTGMVRTCKPDAFSFPKVSVVPIENEEAFYLDVNW
ncbi:hypothetical protein [Desertivirga arenae]|uniref:hypothetical protein n=1 Tax=Desertivirga arenae TaxID=2810309 RepID=UPI001A97841A|nr:hypothetical protein [Pedobacter sp. SYSU D00823]